MCHPICMDMEFYFVFFPIFLQYLDIEYIKIFFKPFSRTFIDCLRTTYKTFRFRDSTDLSALGFLDILQGMSCHVGGVSSQLAGTSWHVAFVGAFPGPSKRLSFV